MRVTILGCGSSAGVPQINGGWGVCDPANPKNRRLRSSILLQTKKSDLLIDCPPDCREQLLNIGLERVDGVLFTHAHADHCHGIDDLRWINMAMGKDIPVYGRSDHLDLIEHKFSYAFEPLKEGAKRFYYKPMLLRNDIVNSCQVGDLDLAVFEQDHGFSSTLGIRVGDFAYSTDAVKLNEAAFTALEGVKVWIVDCFRYEQHHTHSWLEQTLEWIERVNPEKAFLHHMGRQMDYDTVMRDTPKHVEPGYDGMIIEL